MSGCERSLEDDIVPVTANVTIEKGKKKATQAIQICTRADWLPQLAKLPGLERVSNVKAMNTFNCNGDRLLFHPMIACIRTRTEVSFEQLVVIPS